MIGAVLLASAALGYECFTNYGCDWADGSQLTYHINVNDFTTDGATEIEKGGNAWDAGAGENNRGAEWDFIRGSDHTSDGVNGNWTNEVYKRDDNFFSGWGLSGDVAGTFITHFGCGRRDTDIIFNSDHVFTTTLPSANTTSNYSIGIVALHEFGHALGLDHEDGGSSTNLAFMNEFGAAADISADYRLNEDDYVGLVAGKPASNTGKNLMLQKFRKLSNSPTEVWSDPNTVYEGDWEGCPGQVISASSGPFDVLAIINGTSTQTPLIEWRLSTDSSCFSGTEYTLGTRSPTIGSNEPYPVTPNGGYSIPANTPLNDYYLCAKIDPYDDLSETSEADNTVRSEWLFEVHSCP